MQGSYKNTKKKLHMNQAGANSNGKIWFFVKDNMDMEIIGESNQQFTLKLTLEDRQTIITSLVYAKCNSTERLALWIDIYQLANGMTFSWLIGGDFTVILSQKEKIGGLPVIPEDSEDFAYCINSSELFDVGFKGNPFTWWNERTDRKCIFERLDRVIVNQHLCDQLGIRK